MIEIGGAATFRLLDGITHLGLDGDSLCARANINPSTLLEPGVHVPWAACMALLEDAAAIACDSQLGLHAALVTTSRGVPAIVAGSQVDVRRALQELIRLAPIVITHACLQLVPIATGTCLRVLLSTGVLPGERHLLEFIFALVVGDLSRLTNQRFRCTEVRFAHAEPGPAGDYEMLFRCPVRFRQPHTELLIAEEMLRLPLVTYCPELRQGLDDLAAQQLTLATEATFRERVAALLDHALAAGRELSPDEVATRLGLSLRTLQRRLAREHASFTEARDDARRMQAMDLLSHNTITIAAVAARLGFADASAFTKSFRRWTGLTPKDWRRKNVTAQNQAA